MDEEAMRPGGQPGTSIRSLARGLKVLRSVGALERSTLHDIHRVTGLPKPTLVRILTTLEQEGYVWRGMGDNLYRLSSRFLAQKEPIDVPDIVAEFAAPFMDRLSASAGWPSDIAVCQDGAMTIGETTRRRTPLFIRRPTTARVHMLKSSLGRTYLAFCDEQERREILDRLRRSSDLYDRGSRDEDHVQRLVGEVRERGYGLREPGYSATKPAKDEFVAHLNSIAVPVRTNERLYACISLVWIAEALSESEIVRSHLEQLQATADQIAVELSTNALAAVHSKPMESSRSTWGRIRA